MRTLSTLALAGLFGGLLLVGDASAGHKKKAAACAPAPVACVPAPAPVVCEAPVKQKHHAKKAKGGCHKKATPACESYAPVQYASPAPAYYPTPQTYATGQASGQGM